MKITTKAPTRIGLIGGGTDVEPFASKHGGTIIGAAISIYHKVTLIPRNDKTIFIENLGEVRKFSLNSKLPKYGSDKKFDLVYAIINTFKKEIPSGFNMYDRFEGGHSAGLGSSGSAGVAIIAAFNEWLKLNLSKDKIVYLAWEMETKELDWISGKQDQIMAAYGGINEMTFQPKGKYQVSSLNLSQTSKEELLSRLVLAYTGGTRHSSSLQKSLKKGMSKKSKIEALMQLKKSALLFKKELKQKKWNKLGSLLDEAWQNKKKSNPLSTNQRIDFIYDLSKQYGSLGGKIMGAGGEGHMFFFCQPNSKSELIKALNSEEISNTEFKFDDKGLQVTVEEIDNNHHTIQVKEGVNFKNKWAVFLDRDGVINKETHLLHKTEEFELIPRSAQAIKKLNDLKIPVIIFHNASVVARGLCDEFQVQKLHKFMQKKLHKYGAHIDAILYCPHHPTAFNTEYIKDCSWRKPSTGMLETAAKQFNLNLSKSYVVGDSPRDILAGKAVNSTSILVKTGHGGKDTIYKASPDKTVKDLFEAVAIILKMEKIK
jgi:D-glycero-alpha-D-manno-heptose-7-phosphate kinase